MDEIYMLEHYIIINYAWKIIYYKIFDIVHYLYGQLPWWWLSFRYTKHFFGLFEINSSISLWIRLVAGWPDWNCCMLGSGTKFEPIYWDQ